MISRKVGAGAVAGALSVIIVWAIKNFGHVDLPPEVASAGTTLLTLVTSYLIPDAIEE